MKAIIQNIFYLRHLVIYRSVLLYRKIFGKFVSSPKLDKKDAPGVTIFISSLNTLNPLRLTLHTLLECTNYPNLKFIIGENASTDGSAEFLRSFKCRYPVQIIEKPEAEKHYNWLDEIMHLVDTPYWFAIDSDMLFLNSDPITEVIALMEEDPKLDFVASEERAGHTNVMDDPFIDCSWGGLASGPATWFFAVRTDLVKRIETTFGLFDFPQKDSSKLPIFYDTGAKFILDLKEAGLKYLYLPSSFLTRYYHFGSLSWGISKEDTGNYRRVKEYQLRDIDRRVQRLTSDKQ